MKYTLIIGSGIHAHALSKAEYGASPLVSWDALLKKIGGQHYHNPLLGFESLVINVAKREEIPAKKAESLLLQELAKILNEEQPIYTLNKKDAYCNLYGFTETVAISHDNDYEVSWQKLTEFLN